MNNTLQEFIAHARQKDMDHATIRMLLLSAGWKEKDVAQALSSQSLDMPVPLPVDVGGAREAFMHLFSFACLFTTLISLAMLYFEYLNRVFPDPAFPQYAYDSGLSSIRWSMAAVIVTFPLYVWITRILNRDIAEHPDRARSPIRRWLTYITLLVAGLSLVGDVVTLVFYLLEGEITVRFLLKVLVVLLLAGTTFMYYLFSLRLPGKLPSVAGVSIVTILKWVAIVTVVTAIVWGMLLAGSPGTERERKFDERRVEDLRTIQNEINYIVFEGRGMEPGETQLKKPLPKSLVEVEALAVYQRPNITDPQRPTEPYEYIVESDTRYKLCAVFSLARDEQYDVTWNHPAGSHCFAFDALKAANPLPFEPKPAPAPIK